MENTIKIHARVTREIEITQEQAERLVNMLCGSLENHDISDIKKMFTDGIDAGNYEAGYAPADWFIADLINSEALKSETKDYLRNNMSLTVNDDIDL